MRVFEYSFLQGLAVTPNIAPAELRAFLNAVRSDRLDSPRRSLRRSLGSQDGGKRVFSGNLPCVFTVVVWSAAGVGRDRPESFAWPSALNAVPEPCRSGALGVKGAPVRAARTGNVLSLYPVP